MNKLENQVSPYLLQHKNNPVFWEPWGPEALERAQLENKPILVSIGYAACHWCHVMEKESFENQEVADLMNQYFVNIKVDREERPDIDMIYMDAIQQMGLGGGWPLNVFLMPDQKPFYGGTYFPKHKWMEVLNSIHNAFHNHRNELQASADGFAASVNDQKELFSTVSIDQQPELINSVLKKVLSSLDPVFGGINKAPKFPLPSLMNFFESIPIAIGMELEVYQLANLQLNKMAQGGIFDHLSGGFSRYSVDSEWFCPHFEKMLYDNGQLLSVYSKAFERTNSLIYKEIIIQIIAFLDNELLGENGLFFASLDADSEGVEGLYYTWTYDELTKLLPYNKHVEFYQTYSISQQGNWEDGQNILFKNKSILNYYFNEEFKILNQAKENRIKPARDQKQILSWNALTLLGLIDASIAMNDELISEKCEKLIQSMLENFETSPNYLLHQVDYADQPIQGFLDDYATFGLALVKFFLKKGNEELIEKSSQLLEFVLQNFQSSDSDFDLFYYRSGQSEKLIADKIEFTDSVIPSSNSVLCEWLLWMGIIKNNVDYTIQGKKMLETVLDKTVNNPSYFANWLRLYSEWFEFPKVILKFNPLHSNLNDLQLENWSINYKEMVFIPSKSIPQSSNFMICIGSHCLAPTNSLEELHQQLDEII
ncbi:thioredoxin domain-containing protein [Aquirufa sp. ROCK-SH2]